MFNKIYVKHLYNIYIIRLLNVTLVFTALIFIMNILEELKFFNEIDDVRMGYSILLTILNLPSILFEVFPFIILISTQFFFIKFQTNSEILIFKSNGINNLKIIAYICLLVFFIGIFFISIFHFLSSNMKNNYLEFKNKYTKDNKYLAVINENGLWIKDRLNDKIMIIHSEKIDKNILKTLVVTTFDQEFRNETNIIAKEAVITSKIWQIKDALIIDNQGNVENFKSLDLKTNFDYIKINSLFSNLESLNIYELLKQRKDFESVGLNTSDIDIYLHKILSIPILLDSQYKNVK